MKLVLVTLFWLSFPIAYGIRRWLQRDRQATKYWWDGFRDGLLNRRSGSNYGNSYYMGHMNGTNCRITSMFLVGFLATVITFSAFVLSFGWALR